MGTQVCQIPNNARDIGTIQNICNQPTTEIKYPNVADQKSYYLSSNFDHWIVQFNLNKGTKLVVFLHDQL